MRKKNFKTMLLGVILSLPCVTFAQAVYPWA